nr:MAG TPA: hypothetical protein [Caudoviricetes sp.]
MNLIAFKCGDRVLFFFSNLLFHSSARCRSHRSLRRSP